MHIQLLNSSSPKKYAIRVVKMVRLLGPASLCAQNHARSTFPRMSRFNEEMRIQVGEGAYLYKMEDCVTVRCRR